MSDQTNIANTLPKSKPDLKASEGFDILGLENNIKRGKQSNSISVNQLSRNANSISPYESSSFFGDLSFF